MENLWNNYPEKDRVKHISDKFDRLQPDRVKKIADKFDKKTEKISEGVFDSYFIKGIQHEMSENLLENSYAVHNDEEAYKNAGVPEYQYTADSVTDPLKYDFPEGELNVGWKLHLNVIPDNVEQVSEYLKKEGYVHKYLSGGDVKDGKIFTLYIGSHALTKKISQTLSQDLLGVLCKPMVKTEIELAPGVVGRFKGVRSKYLAYGDYGMTLLKDNANIAGSLVGLSGAERTRKYREVAYLKIRSAFAELQKDYGEYFYKE